MKFLISAGRRLSWNGGTPRKWPLQSFPVPHQVIRSPRTPWRVSRVKRLWSLQIFKQAKMLLWFGSKFNKMPQNPQTKSRNQVTTVRDHKSFAEPLHNKGQSKFNIQKRHRSPTVTMWLFNSRKGNYTRVLRRIMKRAVNSKLPTRDYFKMLILVPYWELWS